MSEQKYFNRGLGLKQVVGNQVVRDYHSSLIERMKADGHRLVAGELTFRLAREFGFCYGVDRAIEYAYETREKFPERRVFLTGEIIHNPGVNRRMTELGIGFLDGDARDDLRPEDVVILPAFGVPVADLERLRGIGCVIVDTTCGSVLNVWKNVRKYARDGFTSLIHGKYDHEETLATSSQAANFDGGHFIVVYDMQQAELLCEFIEGRLNGASLLERLPAGAVSPGFDPTRHLERLGCANQTTMLSTESLAIAERVRRAMVARYGEELANGRFRAFDTICTATQDRQDALRQMIDEGLLDLMLIVGGYNSSNTGHLLEIALEHGPAYHILDDSCIESASTIRHQPLGQKQEIRSRDWLPEGPVTIGVTAGASTPGASIESIVRRVAALRGSELPL